MVIWYVAWPLYRPNGGMTGVCCTLRSCEPAYAVSVPDDCTWPHRLTRAVKDIELEKRFTSNGGIGGVGGMAGGGGASLTGGGDGVGGGGEGGGVSMKRGGGEGWGGGGDGRGYVANGTPPVS